MKKISFILSVFLSLSAFAQVQSISNSAQIVLGGKDISRKIIYKTFEIENANLQPFISFDVLINGKPKKNLQIDVQYEKTIYFKKLIMEDGNIEYYSKKEKTEWQTLNQDFHFNNEKSWSSELQYLPSNISSITIKIKNAGKKVEDIDFNFFYPNQAKGPGSSAPPPANCSCPIPAYESRGDWDPSGTHPAQTSPTFTSVTHLIVHHAAGPNTSSDWAATVRSIWNYHVNSNGWSDIGYNYLIDPNGVIYEGRGDNVLGAHFSGFNGGTMGICLLGNYQPDVVEDIDPSTAMQNSLIELLSWKECDIDKDPLLNSYHSASSLNLMHISGHRDAGTGTECPGDNVYDLLPNIRNSSSSYLPNCSFVSNADIIVSALNTNPNQVVIGENTSLNVAVGNAGAADVLENKNVVLKIDGNTIQTFTFDTINSNQILNFTEPNYQFTNLGNHQLCVYIDSASNEANSLNNSFCKTIMVMDSINTFSDLKALDIITSTLDFTQHDDIDFTFEIENQGLLTSSETVQAKIKINGITKNLFIVPVLNSNEVFTKNYTASFPNSGTQQVCVEINSPNNENNTTNNSFCKTFIVDGVNTIQNLKSVKAFKLFPNPTYEYVNLEIAFENKKSIAIALVNSLGQTILSEHLNSQKEHFTRLDISHLSKGIYYFEILIEGKKLRKEIIKL